MSTVLDFIICWCSTTGDMKGPQLENVLQTCHRICPDGRKCWKSEGVQSSSPREAEVRGNLKVKSHPGEQISQTQLSSSTHIIEFTKPMSHWRPTGPSTEKLKHVGYGRRSRLNHRTSVEVRLTRAQRTYLCFQLFGGVLINNGHRIWYLFQMRNWSSI